MSTPTPTSIRRSLALALVSAAFAWARPALPQEPAAGAAAPAPAAPGAQDAQALPAPAPAPGPDAAAPDAAAERPRGPGPDAAPIYPPPPRPPPPPVAPIPPPAVPVPEVSTPPRPGDVFSGKPLDEDERPLSEEHSWFDAGHAFVGRLFFSPAVRLDRFFSDETDLDPERAQSFARLRLGLRLRQDARPQYPLELMANIKLPGVNRWLDRVRLVLSGDSEVSQDDALNPNDEVSPFTSRARGLTNLELRFGAYRGIRSSIDLGTGIYFRIPLGAFARIRYRLAVPIDDIMVARLSPQVFYRTDLHLGVRTSAELDWPFEESSLVRLGVAGQVAQEKVRGLEYGTELVLSHALSRTFAVALGTDAQGSTVDPVRFHKYRVYTRLRHDLLRQWLFLDVTPEVGWPWTSDRGRYRAFAILLRLEVQFEGGGAVEATARVRETPLGE